MDSRVKDYAKPRSIVFEKGDSLVAKAILKAQNLQWDGYSNFHHVYFIAEDGFCYESTLKMKWVKEKKKFLWWNIKVPVLRFVGGVVRTDIETRMAKSFKKCKEIGVQYNFNLSSNDWFKITEKAQEMLHAKYKYGTMEIAGTALRLMRYKVVSWFSKDRAEKLLKKKNPFDKKETLYCIAFVAECMEACGKEYIDVHSSVATVDEGWVDCKMEHEKFWLEEFEM